MSPSVSNANLDTTELVRPLRRVPQIPDSGQHRALRTALKKHGMSDHAAGVVSTIWTNPAAIVPQVENPQRRRVPGAYLLVVSGPVYTARLAPDPNNPRNADQVQFSLAQAVGAPPAGLVLAAVQGVGEMTFQAPSPEMLAEQLDWAIDTTRLRNLPHPGIDKQGIMDPPIGVATTVTYSDSGTAPSTHIFVREGSTRVSHALRHLGVSAQEVLFTLPRSAAPMQNHIARLNSFADKPAEDCGPTEQAAVRCAVTDFELIIGVEPDAPDAVDLSQAIKARVAQDHLNPKKQWTDESRHTTLAEECLDAARAAKVVSENEAKWLGGRLTPAEASKRAICTYGDERAAQTFFLFTTSERTVQKAIRQPIALVLTDEQGEGKSRRRTRVTINTKLPLAVELVARELHGAVPESRLKEFRTTLRDALPRDLSSRDWRPTDRSPEALFDASVEELSQGRVGGAAGTELWVRAAYVLAKHSMIRTPRHDTPGGGDRRPPSEVMGLLLETKAGLLHLRQAIEDDRSGLTPRQVDPVGLPRKSAAGESLLMDNAFLRKELAPREISIPEPLSPEEQASDRFKNTVSTVKGHLRLLENAMRDLEGIESPDGSRLIETEGRFFADQLRNSLHTLADQADEWWEAAVLAQGSQPPTGHGPTESNEESSEASELNPLNSGSEDLEAGAYGDDVLARFRDDFREVLEEPLRRPNPWERIGELLKAFAARNEFTPSELIPVVALETHKGDPMKRLRELRYILGWGIKAHRSKDNGVTTVSYELQSWEPWPREGAPEAVARYERERKQRKDS